MSIKAVEETLDTFLNETLEEIVSSIESTPESRCTEVETDKHQHAEMNATNDFIKEDQSLIFECEYCAKQFVMKEELEEHVKTS